MKRDFCYCNGKRCAIKDSCVRYVEGKHIPKNEDGWWWMEECEEDRPAYIGTSS